MLSGPPVTCQLAAPPCEGGESCDAATGACVALPDAPLGISCDTDASLCTPEECDGGGSCVLSGPPVTCQLAAPPCEGGESCDAATGACVALPDGTLGTPCDADSEGCTIESCDGAGSCVLEQSVCCGNGVLNPGEECDDGADGACPGRCQDDCTCSPCDPQDRSQRACLNVLNKNLQKVASKQGKEILTCIMKGARGILDNMTIEECIIADGKGRVARAKAKTESDYQRKCITNPPCFGATDPDTVNTAAVQKEFDLVHAIFGADLDASIVRQNDPNTPNSKFLAKCQQKVVSKVKKCQDTKLKEFNKCKKFALRLGADDSTDLEACMFPDDHGKIARACIDKVKAQVQSQCVRKGVALGGAFPGLGLADPNQLVNELDRTVECLACLALNTADALSRDCDEVDDGDPNNNSCPLGP